MRSRLKSWCQSSGSVGCFKGRCCCLGTSCCCPTDKERRTSHLEKCQSFYTGLSQGGPTGSLGGPYPPLSAAKKSRTLGGLGGHAGQGPLTSGLTGANFANTESRVIISLSLSLKLIQFQKEAANFLTRWTTTFLEHVF
jgi:hypothetical protein